jgi:hypothetical protein
VESGGSKFFTHKEKECVFTNYYREILGKAFTPQYLIDLDAVYPNSVDLTPLSVPFSEIEIHKASSQSLGIRVLAQIVLAQHSIRIFGA